MAMPVAGLIHFSTFITYFLSPLKVSLHGTSSPPWKRSLEYRRLPIMIHSKEPRFRGNSEQTAEIFFVTWPIILPALTTDTANGSNGFPSSQRYGNVGPQLASQISW